MKTQLLTFLLLISLNLFSQWKTENVSSFSQVAGSGFNRIAIDSNNQIYIAFRHNSFKLSVIKLKDNSWSYLGLQEITASPIKGAFDISIDKNNIPYVVFTNNTSPSNQKISVIRYISNKWENVGNAFFSPVIANNPKITFDGNNIPYVVFEDFLDERTKLSVMKFDNNNWELVGERGFSDVASYTTITTDSNNNPYVAFNSTANGNAGKTSVMKFNGTNWEFVGKEGFSTGFSRNHSLGVNSQGIVYLAYHSSGTNGGSSNVLKFNGTSWEHLGTPGMGFFATEQELFIDKNDALYLSYTETTKNEIQVRKFTGSSWQLLGNSSVGIGNFSDIIKNDTNEIFVAYSGTTSLDVKKITDNTLSTKNNIQQISFSVYPNPTSNAIKISSNQNINKIEIFSTLGKRMLRKTSTNLNNKTIDVSSLTNGIYLLKINDNQFKKILIK